MANETYKIGDKVSVDYFGHRFTGVIEGFSLSGVTVKADVPFEKSGSLREGVWMTMHEFYATVRMVAACEPGSVDVRTSQGHTYGVGI